MTAARPLAERWTLHVGEPADAAEVSALIQSLSAPFFVSPQGEGVESFLASISPEAEAGYLASPRYRYLLARAQGRLVGVVAMRDGGHLFHLFVAPEAQGQGLARLLWDTARLDARHAGHEGPFTVNASLGATAIYKRFGFTAVGEAVQQHGVAFQPMSLERGITRVSASDEA